MVYLHLKQVTQLQTNFAPEFMNRIDEVCNNIVKCRESGADIQG